MDVELGLDEARPETGHGLSQTQLGQDNSLYGGFGESDA